MNAIDILIVNYNSTEILKKCLRSIYGHQEGFEIRIFIWDNHSADHIVETLQSQFPKIQLTLCRQNIGFSAGINRLLTKGDAPYVVILNPDSIIMKDFFQRVISFLHKNPTVGGVGPRILNKDQSIQGSARTFPTPLTSLFGRNSPITKLFPNNSITKANILTIGSDGKTPIAVDWVSGACMVVRRQALEQVAGFDERFFLYWEDCDLCRRIRDAGWDIIYLPKAEVIHIGGKSSNTRPVFSNFHFHKSCYRLYGKYVPWPFSILAPLAGMALMLRFLLTVLFNHWVGALNRIRRIQKRRGLVEARRKSKIKILRVISRMNIGGPSIHVKNLTGNLTPGKFLTRLITGTVSPGEGDMGYITNFKDNVIIFIPELQREIAPYRDLKALLKVVKVIQRFHPDIVHSHTSKAGTISRAAVWICNLFRKDKIIAVHTFHGHVLDGYFNRFKSSLFLGIERLMARVTDSIIAISETQKWELSSLYKIERPDKVITIKLGFDLKPFQTAACRKGLLRKRLGISADTLLIGIVGRMAPIKNHKMFLDAAKALLITQPGKKIKFILVGDGEEHQHLKDYANGLGIKEKVVFTGWQKDIPQIYADLNILALTSLNEGTPVSVIEAMAACVPVISTNVGGIKDLLGMVQPGQPQDRCFHICERGILCPKNDPATFTQALNFMVSSDYLNQNQRFDNACRYVLKNYSIERLVKDIEALYAKLLRRHTGQGADATAPSGANSWTPSGGSSNLDLLS